RWPCGRRTSAGRSTRRGARARARRAPRSGGGRGGGARAPPSTGRAPPPAAAPRAPPSPGGGGRPPQTRRGRSRGSRRGWAVVEERQVPARVARALGVTDQVVVVEVDDEARAGRARDDVLPSVRHVQPAPRTRITDDAERTAGEIRPGVVHGRDGDERRDLG